ncbi:hypothetical protein [Marinomonas posidonica]|uniref:Uncharacterized protein n=1 Tax=Marinomonas posidonica (strain CECT 7376 / NCIMB 14433 / IVIA-Po-181) TaxID=491952 RepID=F6CTZ4_MARPP|nr:hypothetical protein [Marinomonas posidonica]AEF54046.1 hypothetical protein Mar181_0997 [Marinomonas posidonica IVIA-Po-181]
MIEFNGRFPKLDKALISILQFAANIITSKIIVYTVGGILLFTIVKMAILLLSIYMPLIIRGLYGVFWIVKIMLSWFV